MRTIVPSSTQSNRPARDASHPNLAFSPNLFAICSLLARIEQFSKWGPQEYSRHVFIVSLALEKEGNLQSRNFSWKLSDSTVMAGAQNNASPRRAVAADWNFPT